MAAAIARGKRAGGLTQINVSRGRRINVRATTGDARA
jgi:hypothetical protein